MQRTSVPLEKSVFEAPNSNGLQLATPVGRDRRICPRYAFTAAAEALDAQSRARMTARTSDISKGGCYVDTFCPFPRKSDVKIRIVRDKEFLEAQAMVVYSKIGMGMGLCFTNMTDDHRVILDRWIAELSGEPALAFEEHYKAQPPAMPDSALNTAPSPAPSPAFYPAMGSAIGPVPDRPMSEEHCGNNDPALVLGELIIALMRTGGLHPAEGNSLLTKLAKCDCPARP
jgi:hypothetical protein